MALNFGKLNFSTSFNPTSAFPLDARSYFESYEAAVAAAQTAVWAGSAESVYYYGQTLVVVENSKASFYIIQPDRTLSAVAGSNGDTSISVNPDLFEYDESGNLSLIGFDKAAIGTFFTKGADGSLTWVAPIDAYTKTETDEKIAAAISAANHLKRKIVADLNEAKDYIANNDDADQYIFMVPTGLQEEDDKYDEYVVIVVADVPTLERVGSWEVDLSDYAKTNDVNKALEGKVDAVDGYGLISDEQLEKLNNIKDPLITAVDETYFSITDGILFLADLPVSKITDLESLLNSKVNAKEGYGLISATDQKKLDALLLNGDKVEISGTVNAENVVNLAEWINEHASDTVGLSENNLTNELYSKLVSMLYIKSVDTEELGVTDEGHLSIIQVDPTKVVGLQDALNAKASQRNLEDVQDTVASLSEMMTSHSEILAQHSIDIEDLWDAITWQDIK